MTLDDPRRNGDGAYPGEPGVGADLPPPFAPYDDATRWLFGLNRFGMRPGLQRIQGLLTDLGRPQDGLCTLVVAGTNGKGSTTRILARLLRAAGYRVATYTSPHLLAVTERIQIDERPVDRAEFSAAAAGIRPLAEGRQASWFETLTALAVKFARDRDADFLCCEAGMGGRLDASNALPAAAVLLTSVGLDHQPILGGTLAAIAAEKLGLLKRGVPLFCGVAADLRPQVFAAAVHAQSPCHFLDELARWSAEPGGTWDLTLRERVFGGLPDPGAEVLRRNVALALLALTRLQDSLNRPLLPADVSGALGNLFLPGRYQRVLRDPDFIVDTAHNEQALLEVLREFLARPCRGRRVVLFGGMCDKILPATVGHLMRRADAVVASPVALPRSRTPDELAILCREWGLQPTPAAAAGEGLVPCLIAPDLGWALARLAAALTPQDAVLVTGSCFTAAEILHRLGFADLEASRTTRPGAAILAGLLTKET